jgi:hypothetical protein
VVLGFDSEMEVCFTLSTAEMEVCFTLSPVRFLAWPAARSRCLKVLFAMAFS